MIRRALLCGINNYKSVTDLRGCVRDTEDLRSLLLNHFGFRDEDVRVLTDQEVVKSRLKKEWKWLMEGAGPGDTLVFHFSGHGSFVPDREGEDEDGNDELLCLYDMDFKSPNTYLLDDELDAWTRKKPAGAGLVILTDCCHSGTSTRMVLKEVGDKRVTFALDQEATFQLATQTGADPLAVEVVARFLPPPDYTPAREAALRRTRRGEPGPLNHLHLAACQDDETAADAPFGGRYHGAFTYHLCRALEADPRLGSDDLVARLVDSLTAPPFHQRPRANGDPRPGPLFGGLAGGAAPGDGPEPPRGDALREETARELLAAVRDLTAALRRFAGPTHPARAAGRRVLVYVHGIDEHPGDFSGPWWNALRPHVGNVFGSGALGDTRLGVHWSDIVNDRAPDRAPDQQEAALLRRMIERELEERSARYADPGRAAQARGAAGVRGRGPQLDNFLRYMLQRSTRTRVLARFTGAVRPRLGDGETLDVVSHSWGAVVAYEGLLQLEAEGLPGRVANFFTVGAALSIGAVRWQLGLGHRRPAQVGRWVNVDAKGDGVGGGLGANFPVDHEDLELEPTGCSRGWFGYNLACAHGSYFHPQNDRVNRDIFARYILQG